MTMADPSRRDWAIAAAALLIAAAAFLPLARRRVLRRGLEGGAPAVPLTGRAARGGALAPQASAPRESLPTDTLKIEEVPSPGAQGGAANPAASAAQGSLSAPRIRGLQSSAADGGQAPSYEDLTPGAPGGAVRPQGAAPARSGAVSAASKAAQKSASAGAPEKPPPTAGGPRTGRAAPVAVSGERQWLGQASDLASAVKGLDLGPAAGPAAQQRALKAALVSQLQFDQKVDDDVSRAISDVKAAGLGDSPQAVRHSVGDALASNGLPAGDEDVTKAVARAEAPPPQYSSPEVVAAAVQAMTVNPPSPAQVEEILKRPDPPPAPHGPLPRGVVQAFDQNTSVFARAKAQYGVLPEHIIGELIVETSLGHNTGKYSVRDTLIARMELPGSQGKQARSDYAALFRLAASGELGGNSPDQLRGSSAAAIGAPQFLTSSWEAYARSATGGPRDPFSIPDSIMSVANYLNRHGYNKDVAGAIYGYNHDPAYVKKVLATSADVAAVLQAHQGDAPPAQQAPAPR
jgi:membrane-bound lytic murein transglycosylase B